MGQFARPVSDSVVDLWATAPLWSKLDETQFDDADFVSFFYSFQVSEFRVSLGAAVDPVSSAGHVIRARTKDDGNIHGLTITLYQGAATIAQFLTTPSFNFVTDAYTLSAAEANSITNYAALKIGVTGGDASDTATAYCSWLEFEVPDAPGAPALLGQACL